MHGSAGLVAKGKIMSVANRPRTPALASSCAYPERSDIKIAAAKRLISLWWMTISRSFVLWWRCWKATPVVHLLVSVFGG